MTYVSASGPNASNSAGAPLTIPARRRSLFQLGPSPAVAKPGASSSSASSSSSSDSEEEEDEIRAPSPSEQPTTPTPSPAAPVPIKLSLDAIPFPSFSASGSGSGPPSPSLLPRTPSTPVILPNGKPLKPSLKSSLSAPHLPPASAHLRSQSAPSTPNLPKNVHFPERGEDLQTVRLFRPAGRPTAVSFTHLLDNDTETETEGYDSSATAAHGSGYPFPVVQDTIVGLHPDLTSAVPAPNPPTYANVHLETLQLPKTRPYTLCGSVLVRNVAFAKAVAVRFTLDDWQTTSEVAAHYVTSLPALPPPFRPESVRSPLVGDAITALSHANVGWDRFSFQIRLDDVERKLAEKTLWCVVRYTAHGDGGGEWWDNNAGANYRVVFRKEAAPAPHAASSSASSKALASQIRSSAAAGGLPPLQLRTKARPTLQTSLSFGAAPKNTAVPLGPVSPVKGLSLKNYVPPSPRATPPATPPPSLGLGALDFNTTQSQTQQQQQSSMAFPAAPGMGSPIGSPGTSASYEALVRQWCFGGSSASGHGKSASAPDAWMGMGSGRLVGVGELA
ncbi:hypothetical protein AURDEDRAFT_116833 [Auricularia subglabra TFB-10046 SS5]|nr:hypothetical protein AURDEDRAFT_116833 [Auricularia subglabra TFB-10046 SS5]